MMGHKRLFIWKLGCAILVLLVGLMASSCTSKAAFEADYYDINKNGGTFDGYHYVLDDNTIVKNAFFCDGTYTYFLQYDGTPMKDVLTYHPDGEQIIYFDANGHECFNEFVNVKKSIAGDEVDDLCYFGATGNLYVNVLTYNKEGTEIYYANQYGVVERAGGFQLSTEAENYEALANGYMYGYANPDGTIKGFYQTAEEANGQQPDNPLPDTEGDASKEDSEDEKEDSKDENDGSEDLIEEKLTGKTAIFFGDSITWGEKAEEDGVQVEKPYPNVFAEITEADIINCGVCGATASDLRKNNFSKQIEANIENINVADYCFVMFGVNDFNKCIEIGDSETPQSFIGDYVSNIDRILEINPSIEIIVIMPPPGRGALKNPDWKNDAGYKIEEYRNAVKDMAVLKGLKVVDFKKAGITAENAKKYYLSSHNHLTQEGYELLGDYLAEFVLTNK